MNILVAVNQKYVPQLKTLLFSLGQNNPQKNNIYLMSSELKQNTIEELTLFAENRCNSSLHILAVDPEQFKNAKILSHFSVEMYYRIFAVEYLPSDMDRILWLDADIIVKESISEFYQSDFKGKSLVVCSHRELDENYQAATIDAVKRLGLNSDTEYFNSGVILMNLEKMRKEFDSEKTFRLIEAYRECLVYPDQDILNLLYEKDVRYEDKMIYNYQVHYNWTYEEEKEFIEKKVKILHYVGPVKPWGYQTYHFSYDYYWKYYLLFEKKKGYYVHTTLRLCYSVYKNIKSWGRMILTWRKE